MTSPRCRTRGQNGRTSKKWQRGTLSRIESHLEEGESSSTCLLPIPDETRTRLIGYLAALRAGGERAGKRLADSLADHDLMTLTEAELQDTLINTKVPQIFAESAVAGDGSDWNLTELGILGDISIAVPVRIFDNGLHSNPLPHAEPFAGTLVFTPGE